MGDCLDSSGLCAPSGNNGTSAVATNVSAADYLERLKMLRARCGLDSDVSACTDISLSGVAVNATKPHASTSTSSIIGGDVSAVSVLSYLLLLDMNYILLLLFLK